jgi:hypothetical protein
MLVFYDVATCTLHRCIGEHIETLCTDDIGSHSWWEPIPEHKWTEQDRHTREAFLNDK